MNRIDPQKIGDLLLEAADKFILPRFRTLSQDEVKQKAPGDLVTIADVETETYLSQILPDLLPGSEVVGEEAHAKDPSVLDHLDRHDYVWLVDPVDGTVNFAKGLDTFCVMVALIYKGEAIQSWIYLPTERKLAHAERGAGARWGDLNLEVKEPKSSGGWLGQVNLSYFPNDDRPEIKAAASRFGRLERLGCAGQDFLKQCLGERQFAFYRRLWSWDHAPGVLLLQEAGGTVARIDGGAYRISDRVPGLLSAPNEQIWNELKSCLVVNQGS